MRTTLCLLLVSLSVSAMAEEFRCGEPRGASMSSDEGHKAVPDKFSGVEPVVSINGNDLTVVWGGSAKANTKTGTVFKASVLHRSPELISAAAVNVDFTGQSAVLFTLDVKRGFLYTTTHKEHKSLNASSAGTVVSKCAKVPG